MFGTMASGERVSWVNVVVASTRYEIFDVTVYAYCLSAVELQDPRTNITGTCPSINNQDHTQGSIVNGRSAIKGAFVHSRDNKSGVCFPQGAL